MTNKNILQEASYFLCDQIRFPLATVNKNYIDKTKEIRLKIGAPVCLVMTDSKMFLRYDGTLSDLPQGNNLCVVSKNDMDESASRLVNFSIHAFQNEMKKGFITIKGGHRVGICASAIVDNTGEITSLRNISSLNIRIAREIKGASNEIINNVFSEKIVSTLIVGEPSSGKTTILRDLASRLSDKEFGYLRVCIVDERGEIAATSDGVASKNLGVGCDVLDGYPKAEGMMLALRSMSPDIIVCDEIGGDDDIRAIESVVNSGVKIIATIHSDDFSHLTKRPQYTRLMQTSAFDIAIILKRRDTPGKIKEIIPLKRYWR